MSLYEFGKSDYWQLVEWISSDELNYLWGGACYDYPLSCSQIYNHCSKENVFPFIYKIDGRNVGFIELRRLSPTHFRICRVFVERNFRGRGIAKRMLNKIIVMSQVKFLSKRLSLTVFSHNYIAIKCYRSLGFKFDHLKSETRLFKGETWFLEYMDKDLLPSVQSSGVYDWLNNGWLHSGKSHEQKHT